ncbi:hypothetical protein HNP52_003970 [Sphingomonas kyeonggiensis]|uniref:Autotransporter domain-containing protein n=1 Tax=Sphingomonas kyeonggiensis TaxID=1268553 RepID=A0A7W7NTG0_9SPHN|nr:autotransporter outer membrane beta-barrel domain-containing protein [Sphingomonas kyeonggiensis]MBB4840873.1 hypothetical protein [Sphingomonas kyeonggiensis]
MQYKSSRPLPRLLKRSVLLGGAATLSLAFAHTARAQDVVHAQEGTNHGDIVVTGESGRLIVDISRVDANGNLNLGQNGANGPIATSVTASGGRNSLWLAASSTGTFNLIDPEVAQFEGPTAIGSAPPMGGIVYEALGAGTILTLRPPVVQGQGIERTKAVRVAGNGRINIETDVNVVDDPAITVDEGGTAAIGNPDAGRLNLVLSHRVQGGTTGTVVDVYHADRLELLDGAEVVTIRGTGIVGGPGTEIVINDGAEVRDVDTGNNPAAITLVRADGGVVRNAGSIREVGDPDASETAGTLASGVDLEDARLENAATGQITTHGNALRLLDGRSEVINHGLIQSDLSAAIVADYDAGAQASLVRNGATGVIQAIEVVNGRPTGEFGTAYADIGGVEDRIVNAGQINGDILFAGGTDAYLGSVVNGAVTGRVNGLVDGGAGNQDAFGRSYSADGSFALADADIADLAGVRIGFERHGVEALGLDTDVLLTSGATLARGVTLFGDGTIVNEADIRVGVAPGGQSNSINHMFTTQGGAALRFINRGRGEATNGFAFQSIDGNLLSFENAAGAELVARTASGGGIVTEINTRASSQPFRFSNGGTITHSGSGLGVLLRIEGDYPEGTVDPALLVFANSGTISGREGVYVDTPDGAIDLTNSGTVRATGRGFAADGNSIRLDNSGIIESIGGSDTAVRLGSHVSSNFINAGTVRANVGGSVGASSINASAALDFSGSASATNLQGGTIEATGQNSVAIFADGESFDFRNQGVVQGGAGIASGPVNISGVFATGDGAAGAIQTSDSVDTIVNEGTGLIVGDIDLNSYDDRFEARGSSRLTGNLRLGEGADTVLLAGGTITGAVAGGADDDTIAVDLSVAEQTISADQFSGFENIVRAADGSGIVNVVGAFDAASLDIRGVTLRVRQGTTVRTAGDRTFDGSSEAERLIVDGVINDSVRLGAGDDRVEMGNAGGIGGDLDLGAGNDTLMLGTGSTVGATLDGGEDANGQDNDIIGFELTQDMASAPAIIADAINFETIQVSGDHKLTLGLGQSYRAISLINGADLDLTIADGVTLGGIRGDGTSQNVTITGDLTGGVSLGGGSDTLTMHGFEGRLSSVLDGGEDANGLDNDTLNLNIVGTTTFGNGASGFETINVDGTARLVIDGDFAAGQTLNFGAGDNHLEIAPGATFGGTVNGGAGSDVITIGTNAPDSRTLVSAQINDFEMLDVGGDGTLALTGGAYRFTGGVNVVEGGNLELGANTHLTSNVTFSDAHDDRLTLSSGSRITGTVNAGEGAGDRDVLAFQQAAGQVSRLGDFGLSGLSGFEQMAVLGSGEFHVDRDLAAFDTVVLEGGNLVVDAGRTLTGDVLGRDIADPGAAAGDDSVTVAGLIIGDVRLGGGNDTVDNRGRIDGNVDLGAGDDRYIARDGGVVTGTIDGGTGDNTFIFRLGGANGSIPGNVANFNSIGVYGAGTLEIALAPAQRYENFELLEGANLTITEDRGGSIGTIIGDDSAQTVTIGATLTSGVNLNGGNDTLNLTLNGLLSGALDGGENADGSADSDTLNLTLAGASTINGMQGFETVNVTGTAALTMAGTIGVDQSINFLGTGNNHLILAASSTLNGVVDGGAGTDLLEIETGGASQRTVVQAQIRNFEDLVANGSGTLVLLGGNYGFNSVTGNGNLTLGAGVILTADAGVTFGGGNNRLTISSGAGIRGAVHAGDGIDTLALGQAEGFTRALSTLDVTGFDILETTGAGTLRIDRNARFVSVSLNGGTTIVTAGTTLAGNVTGGANADILEVFGSVTGNVDLAGGDDRLVISSLAGISGSVRGGAGTDAVIFDSDATYAAPITVAGGLFDGFENLGVRRGVVSLTGTSAWTEINVTGGRLIGQAGSILTADRVNVAAGATFGSAGIVNADIDVAGTLSPGASPGTMTVNGDVTMRAGSNLLIELTPNAGRDLLDVNGTLTIANGAAMDITGALGNLPGSVLDIVVADAITGRFTTINKSASVFGFVVQNGNRIQIRSEFNNDDDYPANVRASVAYSNQVLRDGYGVQAYTAALNVLTDASGAINQRAFAQLTPEAYGSAMQIGVENGLQLADASRALRLTAPAANGLYGFAQALIGDSDIAGNAATGASPADLRARGFMGGAGYGMGEGKLRIGAFVGRSDIDQTLAALGARTDAQGFFGGIFADAAIGRLGVHAMVSYSDLGAKTRRSLLVSSTAPGSEYRLRSWVADLGVDYTVSLGGLDVTPKLGLTHVGTRRSDLVEQGGGAFALAVEGGRNTAWFADAGVALSGKAEVGGIGIRPYAELGVRRMLSDSAILVAGSYDGAPSAPILVNGAERDRMAGRYGLGLGIDASDNVRFRIGYTGEFNDTRRSSLTAGATIRF